MNNKTKSRSGLIRIDLDKWLRERLPITNETAFKKECLATDHNLFCTDGKLGFKQMTFFEAMQAAFYGNTEMLSWYLTDPDWSITLSEEKKEVIAWFLQNPQAQAHKRHAKYERMRHIAIEASWWIKRMKLSKTKAIDKAIQTQTYGMKVL